MPSLTRRRLRLACNTFAFDPPQDAVLNRPVKLWASNDLAVEIGAFAGQPSATTIVDSVANWSSLTLELLTPGTNDTAPDPATATVRLSKTTSSFSVPSYANWAAASDQHATVTATGDETNLAAGKYWMVVSIQTTDSPARSITLLAGIVEIVQDGYNSAGTAPDVDTTAYTKDESDARYARQFANIVDLTGGGSSKLDGLVTATGAYPVGTLVPIVLSGALSWWRLQAGTTAEDTAAGIVRPNDYDGATNAQIWVRVA